MKEAESRKIVEASPLAARVEEIMTLPRQGLRRRMRSMRMDDLRAALSLMGGGR